MAERRTRDPAEPTPAAKETRRAATPAPPSATAAPDASARALELLFWASLTFLPAVRRAALELSFLVSLLLATMSPDDPRRSFSDPDSESESSELDDDDEDDDDDEEEEEEEEVLLMLLLRCGRPG